MDIIIAYNCKSKLISFEYLKNTTLEKAVEYIKRVVMSRTNDITKGQVVCVNGEWARAIPGIYEDMFKAWHHYTMGLITWEQYVEINEYFM